jgi:class 3 adenylate cyclase
VRENAGAVIKTMGDAIMASFSRPLDAVRAAVDMVERVEALNAGWRRDGHELGLKVGLHEGPALAVNADDRLDYFGQTVNVAARVQALAEAGEIWHTDRVLEVPGVEELLRAHGFRASAHSVSLKGVGEPVPVRQWRREASAELTAGDAV